MYQHEKKPVFNAYRAYVLSDQSINNKKGIVLRPASTYFPQKKLRLPKVLPKISHFYNKIKAGCQIRHYIKQKSAR